jgi:4'-phosphopantetheinyl transferase
MIATSRLVLVIRVDAGHDAKLAGAFRVEAQRERARLALDLAFARAGAPDHRRLTTDDGKPLPNDGWHWSKSHTRDAAAAVVSAEPVGIDVEPIELRRAVRFSNVVSADEHRILGEIDALLFARLWTAKEAVLKRAGVGLAELSDCRVTAVRGPREIWIAHRGLVQRVHQSIDHGFVVSLSTATETEAPIDWTWSA